MTATTSKLGADMLTDELKSNPLFEALKLAVGMLSLHGYEDEAKKVVAEARLARQPAAIDKEAPQTDAEALHDAWQATFDHMDAQKDSAPSVEQDERTEEEPRLVGYAECRCILSQYCDGTCRPIFEKARAASTSANVAQYRNEALSALLVDHSHAASAKDVDAVLKARDAIYSMFANVAQGAAKDIAQLALDWVETARKALKTAPSAADGYYNGYHDALAANRPANLAQGAEAADEKLQRMLSREAWALQLMDQAVDLMTTGQVGKWSGVRSFIESSECADAAPPAQKALTDAARDAARYRWLRKEHFPTAENPPLAQVVWKAFDNRHSSDWANMIDGDDLDAAIDAALTQQPAEG